MDDARLLRLWGKTRDKSDPDPREYHPLLYHLIDVGVAAEALWPLLPPASRTRMAVALGVPEEEARRALVLLLALHDLGKASGFQAKVPGLWERLGKDGITIARVKADEHHAFVTTAVLPKLLQTSDVCGVHVPHLLLATALAHAVGAHHGTFPGGERYGPDVLGGALWDDLRATLAQRLRQALFPQAPAVTLPRADLEDPAAGVLLTGLTTVADWIGSNQGFFLPSNEPDIDAYAAHARAVVQIALRELGWTPQPAFAAPQAFSQIVWAEDDKGNEMRFSPRGVQALVEEMVDTARGSFLLLVEAAMGEGKTEAALYATDRALTTGIARGAAMGLPTQATGNAMFNRVREFLEHRGHSANFNLQLLHGQAEFHDEFQKIVKLGANSAKGGDSPVVAQSWFTKKKQALLAPFGVGTIDQSLMGALRTKHWFVRLFGLAGKVVIFDEVHAYDAYMNALLRRLISWLSALDCSVILLSATLPATTRKELVEAFSPGATLPDAPYPRVTFVPHESPPRCESPGLPEAAKEVALETCPPDFAALAGKLCADLPQGGCGVVICNTVRSAQAAYASFRAALPADWEVLLFHARTLLKWRKARETLVLDKLGKSTRPGVQRPQKLVLIGTQVLEQSLDYDADWMASEFAPVDLLLQRLGRLWRHDRPDRPVEHRRFTLLVGAPESPAALPTFPAGSDLVYDRYLLLRTFLALKDRTAIALPHAIEPLVQEVYDAPEPEGVPDAWSEALCKAKGKMRQGAQDEIGQAEANLIPGPIAAWGEALTFADVTHQATHLRDDDDPETHRHLSATTRLGDPSVTLICLRLRDDGRWEPFCGGAPFVLEKAVPNRLVRDLLLSAVSVAHPKGLFHTLMGQESPPAWADDPHLRYARAVAFSPEGAAQAGPYRLVLQEETGLQIAKEEAE